jgi:5-methylcytosine-specific restriction endonuclease McrA
MTAPNRNQLYGRRWRKAREAFLREHPMCGLCIRLGRVTIANTVDHVVAHKGDHEKFWDQANWMSLCGPCHNSVKQSLEKSGHLKGADLRGFPLDPLHAWNRERAK